MRDIAVIDSETDPFRKGRIPKPFIWGYYNGSEYQQFRSTRKLAQFLSERDEIIYAHNGGKFDFHYLLDELEEFDELTIINGRIAKCHIGLAELRDSFCIVPMPLAAYKKTVIDYAIMEANQRYKPAHWKKICMYLRDDCVDLWELVTAYVKRFGPELTVASSAMKQWRKLSNDPCEVTDENFYNELSSFYYGGRVQCFRSGVITTAFDVYDINSAYAYAMRDKHPYSANYERSTRLLRNADFMRIRCRSHGALPYRGPDDGAGAIHGGLSFPADDTVREYSISKWEFQAGLETDTIHDIKILESLRFMRHTDFRCYIDKFWAERAEAKARGDKLNDIFCKLMCNSLYGKFSANPDNYMNYMIVDPEMIEKLLAQDPAMVQQAAGLRDDGWAFSGELGPWLLAQRPLADHQRRYYNVATGASITGYVRAMLWRAIHSATGVLYCDTDSIAVEAKGPTLKISDALGSWKHEGNFHKAGIAGKKLYIFKGRDSEGKTHYKTASKGARLTHAELWRVARGGSVDFTPEVPTYSVTRELDYAHPEKSFTTRRIVKTAK